MYQAFQRLRDVYDTQPDNFPRIMEYMQDVRVCTGIPTSPCPAASTSTSPLHTTSTQLQACGQPPAEIVKELAPGLEFGPDGMPLLPNMGQGIPGMPRMC